MPSSSTLGKLDHAWGGALHRLAEAARRAALRTQAGAARPLWRGLYELLARGIGAVLTAGQPGASVYVAASLADGEPVYGLSDIDLVVVTTEIEATRRWWRRVGRVVPPVGALVADLATYMPAELADAAAATTFTDPGRSVYLGQRANRDDRGLRERPSLTRPTTDWRLLSGADQRPTVPAPDRQRLRIAAWLELQFWWRQAMRLAADATDDHAAYTGLKLVVGAARSWLALELGCAPPTGDAAVAAVAARMPDEAPSLARALELRAFLGRRPDAASLDESLALFTRLCQRVARRLDDAAEGAGTVEVSLAGAPALPASSLPLVDWRAVVLPMLPDETLVLMAGDPGRRAALATAVRAVDGRQYGGLRTDGLLVLAAREHWTRSFLRGAACPVTDPVSFALLGGSPVARFPRLAGWTVYDLARRAIQEHRAWLAHTPDGATLSGREWLDGRMAGAPAPTREAAKLLTSARAALLHETLAEGAPQLAIGMRAIAVGLGERFPALRAAVDDVAAAYNAGELPDVAALRALRADLSSLAVYAEAPPAVPAGSAVPV